MKILAALRERFSRARHEPFRLTAAVTKQTFVRVGPRKITALNEEHVTSVAHQMEALLIMAEEIDETAPVSLCMTYRELAHFVSYTRQLDELYRTQAKTIEQLESAVKELQPPKHRKPLHER